MTCRHCGVPLEHTFLDLGSAPPSNAYLTASQLGAPERYYPLKVKLCTDCWLVQTVGYANADELFSPDYAYFSSTSESWLAHAATFTQSITRRLELRRDSFVVEVASNDGYLLKNFVAAGVPCLGIEPTASTASAAEKLGIPVLREFFTETLAGKLALDNRQADLIIGNNVLAHVPEINDFVRGLRALLKPGGTITLEFPHVMRLIEHTQFDTAYHEHYSYLSLYTVSRILSTFDLRIIDVDELPTHGGSLRIYACHAEDRRSDDKRVAALLAAEEHAGLRRLDAYDGLQKRANSVKDGLVSFLIERKRAGRTVALTELPRKATRAQLRRHQTGPAALRLRCGVVKNKANSFRAATFLFFPAISDS